MGPQPLCITDCPVVGAPPHVKRSRSAEVHPRSTLGVQYLLPLAARLLPLPRVPLSSSGGRWWPETWWSYSRSPEPAVAGGRAASGTVL